MAQGVTGRETGVFAPRLKGGTADGMERATQRPTIPSVLRNFQDRAAPSLPSFVTNQPTLPAGRFFTNLPQQPVAGTTTQINPNVIPKGYMDAEDGIAWALSRKLDAEAAAAEAAAAAAAGGGGGSNPYTDAIRVLQQQISSGKYGRSYDRLSTQLGRTGRQAGRDIDAASLAAIAGLSSQDPMSQYSYAPSTAQIPQAALSDYLASIGAGTNEVDANRNFLQSMIDSENAQALQYTSEVSQAQNAQRDAAIQAVYGNQAYSQSQLGAAQQAQEFAIKAAREAELKKLQDQIMQYTLQGGKR
jgi:hypothetical protein